MLHPPPHHHQTKPSRTRYCVSFHVVDHVDVAEGSYGYVRAPWRFVVGLGRERGEAVLERAVAQTAEVRRSLGP